ncbi:MAG: hypothetical protein AAGD38_07565 [Acidobacteriota bacterium]
MTQSVAVLSPRRVRPDRFRPRRAVPREVETTHLTGWSRLRRHVQWSSGRRYEPLLEDMGVDADAIVALRGPRPMLMFAEQAGCWLCPRDLLRVRLTFALAARLRIGARVLALGHDVFTATGDKKSFLGVHLHHELGPVRFLGWPFIRRSRHRSYSTLRLDASTLDRMRHAYRLMISMLDAARHGPHVFSTGVGQMFDRGVPAGFRRLLPVTSERGALRELAASLRAEHDLDAAIDQLVASCRALRAGTTWRDYWVSVNGRFLDTPVEPLEPLLNALVLTIRDPALFVRRLATWQRTDRVAVVGVHTPDDQYRIVYGDPATTRLTLVTTDGEREISWSEIRELAGEGRTGGPCGVAEYLLFAAMGRYLVTDFEDGLQSYQSLASEIHREYLGCEFPWTTFGCFHQDVDRVFLDAYRHGFDERVAIAIDRFFDH